MGSTNETGSRKENGRAVNVLAMLGLVYALAALTGALLDRASEDWHWTSAQESLFAASARGDVTSVREGVHPRPLAHPFAVGETEQRAEVVDVRVHAAVRHEPEQVDVAPALACTRERGDECLVLGERAVLDCAVHPREILEEDPPGADREVTDLGVAHLPSGQADCLARRGERPVRVPLEERVEHGRVGELDGVARAGWRDSPPVEDDEDDGSQTASAAARQTASNDATSSEAPPTSAPSTSGSARRTPAFSGFTEPP